MRQGSVTSSRGTTYYWISRCGITQEKTLVFTHGLTADHRMFVPQIEHFRDKCDLILWDVPLHGLSQPYSDFSYAHTAEELAAILDAEDVASAVLIGMSMGGYPSQAFAERYPERVEGFVALDTTPFGEGYYSKSDLWWLKQTAPIMGWFPTEFLKKWIVNSTSCSAAGRALYLEILEGADKRDLCTQTEAAFSVLAEENHAIHLPCPVLILVGERDKTGKCKQYCKVWADREGYPLIIIPDAAHMSNMDNALAVNHAIGDFLNTL